jgi:hypothetical protein
VTEAIGPGSLVVCIKNLCKVTGPNDLTLGAVYRIDTIFSSASIGLNWSCVSCRGKTLCKIIEKHRFIYCPVCTFKPLNDGDTSLVEHEKELEDVNAGRSEREDANTPNRRRTPERV